MWRFPAWSLPRFHASTIFENAHRQLRMLSRHATCSLSFVCCVCCVRRFDAFTRYPLLFFAAFASSHSVVVAVSKPVPSAKVRPCMQTRQQQHLCLFVCLIDRSSCGGSGSTKKKEGQYGNRTRTSGIRIQRPSH